MNPLLADHLARCLRDPANAPRWHQLAALCAGADDAERAGMVDALGAPDALAATAAPNANLLRLSFIAGLDPAGGAREAAARLILDDDPVNPDCMAGWMSYAALAALQGGADRASFAQALSSAHVPEMASRLAARVTTIQQDCAELPRRVPQSIARVALILPYVGNAMHTPSTLALNHARVCLRLGWSVQAFSCQEMTPPDIPLYRGDGGNVVLAPLDPQHWANSLPGGMALSISDARLGMDARWREMLHRIAAFDPDLVFLAGLYSPLAASLHSLRPTLGLNVHTMPPIAPMDVWLTADARLHRQRIRPFGGQFASVEAHHHPYRLLVDSGVPALPRRELGLPADALLAITVGFRLPHEIQGEFAARMVALLRDRPALHWLLLGGDGSLPAALADAPRGQVHALAARRDVTRLLKSSDLFLNPPRMGGGFSVAEAMACAVPTLGLAGSDGGDKLGEDASASLDAYFARLDALMAAPEARHALGAKLRARYVELYDLNSAGPSLRQAALRALALFEQRAR